MKNYTNEKTINLRLYPAMLGYSVLIIISFFLIYLQIIKGKFELFTSSLAVLLFIYSIFMSFNLIDKIVFNEDGLILRKKFRKYILKNISLISIIRIKLIGIIVLRFEVNKKRNITGYYFYFEHGHEKLIELFQNQNISYKIKTI